MAISLADAKVIVQGQRANPVVHGILQLRCSNTHPHNFEEIEKRGNYQKVQIRRRQVSAPSVWSRTFNFELLLQYD